ncbi:MAG: endonuclease/exonuclease/phosphatase family protein [Candidatus Thiodiazotropha sp. (ex Ctena orbiculata)]|nr:endonuclease/exonuclease/phosphatase family protein [Candidatus Thiodiazotropha taylori]
MKVTVGTFNLNNLFSRFNFSASISTLAKKDAAVSVRYQFTDDDNYRVRTFKGRLVKAKKDKDTKAIADRIKSMDVDVLAVQEVENIDILKEFNRKHLGNLYPHRVLIEGNDPRLIDVGVLSKLPIGAVTSFQTAVHPEASGTRVFGRDLLEVEIQSQDRSKTLFTLYNTHLKSHFGDDEDNGKVKNDTRRRQQAESIQKIVADRMRTNSRYVIVGDMNDGPEDAPLSALKTIEGNDLVNALENPIETRPAKEEKTGPGPQTTAWTHRFKKSGQPPEHRLFDQIWLSPKLAEGQGQSFIDRRTKHGGNGSDHDPAWVELDGLL